MKPLKEVMLTARKAFESGRSKPAEFRERQLRALLRMYEENEKEIIAVLCKDLRRPQQETVIGEVVTTVNDLKLNIAQLDEMMKPARPAKNLQFIMDEVQIIKEPLGVVLIMGTWNYPLMTVMMPMHGAIAAGNCVVVKPSEMTSASEKFLLEMLPKYLDNECFQVVCGGIEATTELLKEKFDYIFLTGSTAVGRVVHAAAAKHMTPTTLELGGKSPVYLDGTAQLEVAVRRLLWGKFINAGQTCVGPDYLLCSKDTQEKFLEVARKIMVEWYGEDAGKSQDLGRIINQRHFRRIQKLLEGTNVAIGGNMDESDLFVEPTILIDVDPNHPVMQDEIFAPILPIVNVESAGEAISFINSRDKPLALYVFSNNRCTIDLMISNVSCGGVCVNDTIVHLTAENLPFGGVGASGMGRYHGQHTFETFSHQKSVLIKNLGAVGEKLAAARYPPYTEGKLSYMKFVTTRVELPAMRYLSNFLLFGLGVASTMIYKTYEKMYR